ncbi:unnamed protein product [Mytilus edulis]|uniref:B box-type domain-containing protein n=1 Tax=Mytilus edulis TaxID=6550 RepID=A0A8S3TFP7_MYTED|nr:unnamed protein product [Mytilus edulis]
MAKSLESTSRRKAQVPVSCYFCKGQEIKWECKDCDVRMCYSCKVTIHKGLQSAQDHDVVSIQDIIRYSPMISVAIHVNKENEVVVGIREQGPPFPVKDFSVRQVIIFDSNYKRKVTLEFDKKGIKLFSYALRIRTDSRNVVYVIDRFDNDNNGRIVAVHRNGRLKFTFDGQTYLETFKPQGITITPSNNIVVSDSGSNALHVLNSNGDLLALQLVKDDLGIQSPLSLCFDAEGYLLIGCHKGKNEDYGKIHAVKMVDSLM